MSPATGGTPTDPPDPEGGLPPPVLDGAAGRPPVVAIDGPAGSGKSTVARRVAEALGVPHLDTGAYYRAVALACLRAGVDLDDGAACAAVATSARIDRPGDRTHLDGEDVEDEIRGPAVTEAVARVSAHPGVREALLPLQRAAAAEHGGVVEGRDIGTVVLPDADVKVFLDASAQERARRRADQAGVHDYSTVLEAMQARDSHDAARVTAPLAQASDAWRLDTTGLTVDEVVAAVVERVEAVRSAPRPLPRVVVVGRPNVGKSTLVNRVLGRRAAIVEEKPGVTRDRTEHEASWAGVDFLIVDTGGWEHGGEGLTARVAEQAAAAATSADLVLFMVDATVGALDDDERYTRLLRRAGAPALLVANKVDGARHDALVHDLYGLGLGDAIAVSARHGRGMGELLDEVVARLPKGGTRAAREDVPRVAIVGRPNVGKSSLFNRLLGEERSLVDPVPHTTRDAVDTRVEIEGDPWVFVDTAGMRRRHRHGERTEWYSVERTEQAIRSADLALFVIDASEPIGEQDQRLAAALRDAGCGLVVIINKWDLVDEDRRHDLEREYDRLLAFASWAPRVNVSALTGRGLGRIVPALRVVWDTYRFRVPTRELNRAIADLVERVAPPLVGGGPLRIRYATQAETRPPTFVVFTNRALPPTYRRYLENSLRDRYDFTGTPMRVEDRRSSRRELNE